MSNSTINKKWLKNRINDGKVLARMDMKLTDDYAFDYATNFGKEEEFTDAKGRFSERFLNVCYCHGDKSGIMKLSFASCQYYTLKLKEGVS